MTTSAMRVGSSIVMVLVLAAGMAFALMPKTSEAATCTVTGKKTIHHNTHSITNGVKMTTISCNGTTLLVTVKTISPFRLNTNSFYVYNGTSKNLSPIGGTVSGIYRTGTVKAKHTLTKNGAHQVTAGYQNTSSGANINEVIYFNVAL